MIRSEHILSIFGEKSNMHILYVSVGDMWLELMLPPSHCLPPPPPPPLPHCRCHHRRHPPPPLPPPLPTR